jgi:hypothetical protein
MGAQIARYLDEILVGLKNKACLVEPVGAGCY